MLRRDRIPIDENMDHWSRVCGLDVSSPQGHRCNRKALTKSTRWTDPSGLRKVFDKLRIGSEEGINAFVGGRPTAHPVKEARDRTRCCRHCRCYPHIILAVIFRPDARQSRSHSDCKSDLVKARENSCSEPNGFQSKTGSFHNAHLLHSFGRSGTSAHGAVDAVYQDSAASGFNSSSSWHLNSSPPAAESVPVHRLWRQVGLLWRAAALCETERLDDDRETAQHIRHGSSRSRSMLWLA